MGTITIEVWDVTGNEKQVVEVPAEAPVNRVIAVLDDRSPAAAGDRDGDVVRLLPEIAAGWGPLRGREEPPRAKPSGSIASGPRGASRGSRRTAGGTRGSSGSSPC